MNANTQTEHADVVRFTVLGPAGEVAQRELALGETLLIGSGEWSGIVLPEGEVAAMHCTLSNAGGLIRVRDWNTASGTFVDGQKVEAETDVPEGAEIQIGPYRFKTARGAALPGSAAIAALEKVDSLLDATELRSPPACDTPSNDAATGETPAVATDPPPPATSVPDADSVRDTSQLDAFADESVLEHAVVGSDAPTRIENSSAAHVEDQRTRNASDPQTASPTENKPAETYDPLPFDDDTLELLKAEVELLQGELADRDARLAELESLADFEGDGGVHDTALAEDSPQVVALVERLEQLLDELERCDERMSAMADLLRAAEDANAAEAEERRQIEDWIAEIERRLTHRDRELEAERQVLQKRVADLTAQLERAERQLAQTATHSGDRAPQAAAKESSASPLSAAGKTTDRAGFCEAGSDPDNYLAEMRHAYEELTEQLRRSEDERERLLERLGAADVEAAETRTQAAVDEALREERLAIAAERTAFSQERATLARERAELVRLRDQLAEEQKKLETKPGAPTAGWSADERIRAFRDHLREIHLTESPPAQPQGLSARIGKIWRRLEGRPLDTD